jgi:hypothetical protein
MRFGVSVRTIKRWFVDGRTCLEAWQPDHMIGKCGLRFTKKSVMSFEQKNRIKPEDIEV